MKVVDKVETKEELLSETQENDLFYQLVRGKDITETIETKRGSFIVKISKRKRHNKNWQTLRFKAWRNCSDKLRCCN